MLKAPKYFVNNTISSDAHITDLLSIVKSLKIHLVIRNQLQFVFVFWIYRYICLIHFSLKGRKAAVQLTSSRSGHLMSLPQQGYLLSPGKKEQMKERLKVDIKRYQNQTLVNLGDDPQCNPANQSNQTLINLIIHDEYRNHAEPVK